MFQYDIYDINLKTDAVSQSCNGAESYVISKSNLVGAPPVECAKGCVSCVTSLDCSFCTPTSYFNSGIYKCVCKFDYNVTIDDSRQSDNEDNSNITISIRNFNYDGDFLD